MKRPRLVGIGGAIAIGLLFAIGGFLSGGTPPLIAVVLGVLVGSAWYRSRCRSCGLPVLRKDNGAHLPPRFRYTRMFPKNARCSRCGGET